MASAWGLSWGGAWGSAFGALLPPQVASLGGWSADPKPKKKRKKALPDEQITEALPPAMVSRLKDEMLAASLTKDVIERAANHAATVKRVRAEEMALLLMI